MHSLIYRAPMRISAASRREMEFSHLGTYRRRERVLFAGRQVAR